MLATLFKNLFGTHTKANTKPSALLDVEKSFDEFLIEEIVSSGWVKPEYKNVAHQAITSNDYLKNGDVLTSDEKRTLNLNTRLKVTRPQVNALTDEGLKTGPSKALSILHSRALHRHSRLLSIQKMRHAGFSKAKLLGAGDERECEWCKEQDRKTFPIDTNFDALIQKNCTCDYCRCCINSSRS